MSWLEREPIGPRSSRVRSTTSLLEPTLPVRSMTSRLQPTTKSSRPGDDVCPRAIIAGLVFTRGRDDVLPSDLKISMAAGRALLRTGVGISANLHLGRRIGAAAGSPGLCLTPVMAPSVMASTVAAETLTREVTFLMELMSMWNNGELGCVS